MLEKTTTSSTFSIALALRAFPPSYFYPAFKRQLQYQEPLTSKTGELKTKRAFELHRPSNKMATATEAALESSFLNMADKKNKDVRIYSWSLFAASVHSDRLVKRNVLQPSLGRLRFYFLLSQIASFLHSH